MSKGFDIDLPRNNIFVGEKIQNTKIQKKEVIKKNHQVYNRLLNTATGKSKNLKNFVDCKTKKT